MPPHHDRSLRRRALACALMVVLAGCGSGAPEPPARRPNVILILVDTLRADRVGWHGGGTGLTPFLDSLAETGSVFWNAYAPSSWTCPVIASLFTARFPSQHRVDTFGSVLDPTEETLAEQLHAAGYATAGLTANLLVNASLGYGQGFDDYRIYYSGPIKERAPALTRDALAWIERSQGTRPESPFFLYLHLMEPHEPLQPSPDALEAVAARRSGDPGHRERLEALAQNAPPFSEMSRQQIELARELYDAEVASLDAPLRRFFNALRQRGILDQTLVIVTADHGEEFLEHGDSGHGHTLYNELIHVPLLVSLPGQTQRIDVREVVSLVDLAPTILEAAGIARPAAFEGTSRLGELRRRPWWRWLRALLGGANAGSAFSELERFGATKARPKPHARALVAGSRKRIERRDDTSESYDLATDPGETRPGDLGPLEANAMRDELQRRRDALAGVKSERTQAIDAETRERMRALGYDDRVD